MMTHLIQEKRDSNGTVLGLQILGNLYVGGSINTVVKLITAGTLIDTTLNDFIIIINKTAPSATTVLLPQNPQTGQQINVKDGKGDCETKPITVTTSDGKLIDGQGSFVISTGFTSILFVYNGTQWNLV